MPKETNKQTNKAPANSKLAVPPSLTLLSQAGGAARLTPLRSAHRLSARGRMKMLCWRLALWLAAWAVCGKPSFCSALDYDYTYDFTEEDIFPLAKWLKVTVQ